MGDDPYDFEIAIPSSGGDNSATSKATGYGNGSRRSRRYGGSSDDSSDVSISASDDDDDGESSASIEETTKTRQQILQRQAVASSSSAKAKSSAAAPSMSSSSGSALDKAKNFLSKYSTKTGDTRGKQPPASARSSRRIELSMDDSMDFSPDEEEEEEESEGQPKSFKARVHATSKEESKKSVSIPAASATTSSTKTKMAGNLSESEEYGEDSDGDSEDDRDVRKKSTSATEKRSKANSELRKGDSESENDDNLEVSQDNDYGRIPAASASVGSKMNGQAPRSDVGYDEEDEEDDDAVASFVEESEEGDPPPFSAIPSKPTASPAVSAPIHAKIDPKPTISQVSKPAYDEVDSNDEESIASKSDYVDSFEEEFSSRATPAGPSSSVSTPKMPPTKQSIASESGVYGEEDFDEESEIALSAPARTTSIPQTSKLDDSTKNEPNFDYSMDFSEDNGDGKKDEIKSAVSLVARAIAEYPTPVAHEKGSPSSSSKSQASQEHEHSGFLDDSDGSDGAATNEPLHAPEDAEAWRSSPDSDGPYINEVDNFSSPASALVDLHARTKSSPSVTAADHERDVSAPETTTMQAAASSLPAVSLHTGPASSTVSKRASLEPTYPSAAPTTSSTTRSRVTIVREYEQPTRENVEMKDAATQFTGNHAGIQADLIPDGMHNLFARSSPQTPSEPLPTHQTAPHATAQTARPETSNQSFGANPHATAPPAPMLPSPGYSMDALRLPTATTTSIYKQQLAALQEQILLKKRETERLVQERMTFQYSTLRGTERFLSSNRPGKLELWQALMRVDPTLNEQKAREIARLTAESAEA